MTYRYECANGHTNISPVPIGACLVISKGKACTGELTLRRNGAKRPAPRVVDVDGDGDGAA